MASRRLRPSSRNSFSGPLRGPTSSGLSGVHKITPTRCPFSLMSDASSLISLSDIIGNISAAGWTSIRSCHVVILFLLSLDASSRRVLDLVEISRSVHGYIGDERAVLANDRNPGEWPAVGAAPRS